MGNLIELPGKIDDLWIGYVTDLPRDYAKALNEADTLDKLNLVTKHYAPFAWDADEIVAKMDEEKFQTFRRHMESERRGKHIDNGDSDWVATILMPDTMFVISLVAERFKAPWGVACIRLWEIGKMKVDARGRFSVDLG